MFFARFTGFLAIGLILGIAAGLAFWIIVFTGVSQLAHKDKGWHPPTYIYPHSKSGDPGMYSRRS